MRPLLITFPKHDELDRSLKDTNYGGYLPVQGPGLGFDSQNCNSNNNKITKTSKRKKNKLRNLNISI